MKDNDAIMRAAGEVIANAVTVEQAYLLDECNDDQLRLGVAMLSVSIDKYEKASGDKCRARFRRELRKSAGGPS